MISINYAISQADSLTDDEIYELCMTKITVTYTLADHNTQILPTHKYVTSFQPNYTLLHQMD